MKRFLTLLLALLLMLCGCSHTQNSESSADTTQSVWASAGEALSAPLDLGQGLLITDIMAYTGAYMEDGSNEVVSDVLMVILKNNSDKALQCARITLNFGTQQAQFSVTNIPAGEQVVLLEKNRMAYIEGLPDGTALADVVFLPELPMYEDLFAVTGQKGILTVKNISDTAVSGDIYVYYKNCSQDLLYGGITYRVRISGLAAGQSENAAAPHFNPSTCVVLMITYAP